MQKISAQQGSESQGFTIIGPMDVLYGMARSWILVAVIMAASLVVGGIAATIPDSKFEVTSRIIPASAQDVQIFRSLLGKQPKMQVVPLTITNIEMLKINVGGQNLSIVDSSIIQLFYEYVRNLDSEKLKREFVGSKSKLPNSDTENIIEAISSITFKYSPVNTGPESVTVTMRSKIGGEEASLLLNEYLGFLVLKTKEEMVMFVRNRIAAGPGNQPAVDAEFSIEDLEVVTIDRPATPPANAYFPNRN